MHYVYKIVFEDGQYYIGVRKLPAGTTPMEDSYMGSGKAVRRLLKTQMAKKQVLAVVEDKHDAYRMERQLVSYDLLKDPLCLNLVLGGRGGYLETVPLCKRWQRDKMKLQEAVEKTAKCRRGKTKRTDESLLLISKKLSGRTKSSHYHVARMAQKLSGRTKHTHPYLQVSGEKVSRALRGKTRPDTAKRMSSDSNPSRRKALQDAIILQAVSEIPPQLLMQRHSIEKQREVLELAKLSIPRKQIFEKTGVPESTVNAFLSRIVRFASGQSGAPQ